MTMLELYENGTMDFLAKSGAISIDRYAYRRYYQIYQAYRAKGIAKQESIFLTMDESGIKSETTIRKAIKFMQLHD